MIFFFTENIPLPTVLITNFVGAIQLSCFSVTGTLLIIYADDTTLYSNCIQTSDLCELKSDLRLQTGAGSGLLISKLEKINWFRLTGLITLVLLM